VPPKQRLEFCSKFQVSKPLDSSEAEATAAAMGACPARQAVVVRQLDEGGEVEARDDRALKWERFVQHVLRMRALGRRFAQFGHNLKMVKQRGLE
jgi:hypothetical protein